LNTEKITDGTDSITDGTEKITDYTDNYLYLTFPPLFLFFCAVKITPACGRLGYVFGFMGKRVSPRDTDLMKQIKTIRIKNGF
jgi:hypothetical protein